MALSHAISYQNMSLHPPTPVPFFDSEKCAMLFLVPRAWSLPCYGTGTPTNKHQPDTPSLNPNEPTSSRSHAGLNYGEIL